MRTEFVPILNTITALVAQLLALWVLWDIVSQLQRHLNRRIHRRRKQNQLNAAWEKLVSRLLDCPHANQTQSEILRFVDHQSDYVIDGYFHALDAVEHSCGIPVVRAFANQMGWLYYEYVLALHFISEGRSYELSPAQAIHNDIIARCENSK